MTFLTMSSQTKRSALAQVIWIAAVLAAAALAIAACDNALQTATPGSQSNSDSSTGALRLSIGTVGSLGLVPDISMTPARYQISGVGPDDDEFGVETGDSTVTVSDLAIGTWSVTVDAFNDTDDHIGSGIGTVTVEAGRVSGLSLSVRPLSGPGTLELEVTWLEEALVEPAISARLIAPNRSERELEFTMAGGSAAEFQADDIDAGYYTLAMQLLDDEVVVTGAVQSVRIAEGARTHGSYEFYELNEAGGGVDIVITPELDEPLQVSISGAAEQIGTGESMAVTAETDNAGGDEVFYSWYVNGTPAGSGESAEIGSELPRGSYRLDAVAFSSDGCRSGSVSHSFTVGDDGSADPQPEPEYEFIDTFENGEIDTDKWQIGTWREHGGQLSRDRAYVENDKLVLVFEYDTEYYEDTGLFKSSAIQTRRDDFGYGRWEARLRIPDVDGVLPTMYTIDWRDPDVRTRQEIDIEFVTINISDDYSEVHFAVHGAEYDSWETQVELPFNPADDYHVWGFDITEERIQWFVDDIVLYEYYYDEQPGRIDAPYMLKFNFWSAKLEDGGAGNWIQGPPVANTEIYYHIDWVRFTSHE